MTKNTKYPIDRNQLSLYFWILVVLNIIDVGLTYLILSVGGYEINPLLHSSIEIFGVIIGIGLVKGLGILFLGIGLYSLHKSSIHFNDFTYTKMIAIPKLLLIIGIIGYFVLNVYSFCLLLKL